MLYSLGKGLHDSLGCAQAHVRSGASSGGCAVAGPACGVPAGVQRSWVLTGIPGRAGAALPGTELKKQHQPGELRSGRRGETSSGCRGQVASLVHGRVSVSTAGTGTAKRAGGGGGMRRAAGRSWGASEGWRRERRARGCESSSSSGCAGRSGATALVAQDVSGAGRPRLCRSVPASLCNWRVPTNASMGE